MCPLTPIETELLSAQFEGSCFPVWLVDSRLNVIFSNRCAVDLYPTHCLTDGIRLFLSPDDSDRIIRSIKAGVSLSIQSALTTRQGMDFSFSPYITTQGEHGAYVMLSPQALATPPSAADTDLRQVLSNAGNLVMTGSYHRCLSEIFYSLSICSSKLKSVGVNLLEEEMSQINVSCYQMMRTTNNLSEAIKLSSGVPAAVSTVNFWDCCAELFEACGTLLRNNHLDFSYTLPSGTVYVDCNFERISSAMLQLISNAYVYSDSHPLLKVTGSDLSGRLLLTFSDNGPGLPAAVTDKLFQPFCSGESLGKNTSASGLGLHLVRSIISEAGGSVTVNSDTNGTTIAISLPQSQSTDQPPLQMGNTSLTYLQDRFSSVYIGLCDIIKLPKL